MSLFRSWSALCVQKKKSMLWDSTVHVSLQPWLGCLWGCTSLLTHLAKWRQAIVFRWLRSLVNAPVVCPDDREHSHVKTRGVPLLVRHLNYTLTQRNLFYKVTSYTKQKTKDWSAGSCYRVIMFVSSVNDFSPLSAPLIVLVIYMSSPLQLRCSVAKLECLFKFDTVQESPLISTTPPGFPVAAP